MTSVCNGLTFEEFMGKRTEPKALDSSGFNALALFMEDPFSHTPRDRTPEDVMAGFLKHMVPLKPYPAEFVDLLKTYMDRLLSGEFSAEDAERQRGRIISEIERHREHAWVREFWKTFVKSLRGRSSSASDVERLAWIV